MPFLARPRPARPPLGREQARKEAEARQAEGKGGEGNKQKKGGSRRLSVVGRTERRDKERERKKEVQNSINNEPFWQLLT